MIEFAFSKEKLIYGPAQIEARIDQDTTHSAAFTLESNWLSGDSRQSTGNSDRRHATLCRAFLFERRKPAVTGTQTPDRFHGRSCGYGAGLREFASRAGHAGRSKPAVVASAAAPPPGGRANESPPSGANAEALNHYRRAFEALNKGDWRTFGAEMDAMQKALQSAPAKSPP